MVRQRSVAVLFAMVVGCASAGAQACDVQIQVTNSSTFTIVAVTTRSLGSDTWSANLISGDISPNGRPQVIAWSGTGDYEIGVEFTTRTRLVVPAQSICGKSRLVAGPRGVVVQ